VTQPIPIFLQDRTVTVRLSNEATLALGAIVGTEFPLRSLQVLGGYLLAEYQNDADTITRYLLPPGAVMYARQQIDLGPAPQPPVAG